MWRESPLFFQRVSQYLELDLIYARAYFFERSWINEVRELKTQFIQTELAQGIFAKMDLIKPWEHFDVICT